MALGWQEYLQNHPASEEARSQEFWEGFLVDHPDVLHRLLADVYQAARGSARPPTLDDLWQIVGTPRFSNLPFGDAVRAVLGKRSERWLARQIGLHQSALNRTLNGEREVVNVFDPQGSMRRIEVIARELRVHPSYFAEWRRLWIMTLIDGAFTANPDLSVGVYRRFAAFDPNGR